MDQSHACGRIVLVLTRSEAGNTTSPTVVYFHGTGQGKKEIPFRNVVELLEAHVVMFERPGYGSTPPMADASLLDIAGLVLDQLDQQGVDRFAVLGWSGGGPHALACAALAPDRVRAVGLLSSWATMTPPDPGLPVGVRLAMRAAPTLPRPALRVMFLLGSMLGLAPRGVGALREPNDGFLDDVRRVARPWGFDVKQVAASVPVLAWHAEDDPQVPVTPWRNVPGVELAVLPGGTHEVSSDVWKAALRRVARVEGPPPSRPDEPNA
jgi:pimeloyl-ACP methyl ester carboxylesterase